MKISTFDTTLRDGTQGESISFSVDDKLIIAQKLDELGIDYIEGGWPGSNPKDQEFFKRATGIALHHARLTAFGSTRFAKNPVHEDRNVRALVEAGTPVVSIFGKTWDLHVKRALGITRFAKNPVHEDRNVRALVEAGPPVVSIFGKTWDLHVKRALGITRFAKNPVHEDRNVRALVEA